MTFTPGMLVKYVYGDYCYIVKLVKREELDVWGMHKFTWRCCFIDSVGKKTYHYSKNEKMQLYEDRLKPLTKLELSLR